MDAASAGAPETPNPAGPAASRRFRSSAALIAVAAALFALGLVVWVGRPRTAAGPLKSTRDADGQVHQTGEVAGPVGVPAQATLLNAQSSSISTLSSSHSGGALVFADSIAILNLSEHLLLQRVGLQLYEQLQQRGEFTQVQYVPHGSLLPAGGRLPDLFLTLDLKKWEERGIPGRVNYDGVLLVTVGPDIRQSNSSVSDSFSPPRVDFHSTLELEYKATQTGLETAAAQYQTVSRKIAEELSGKVVKELQSLDDKFGAAPPMAAEFYPPYQPPPQWKFLETLAAEKVIDGSTFLQPTKTQWRVTTRRPPAEFWPVILPELAETGWKVPEWSAENLPESIRASQGVHWLQVFPERRGVTSAVEPQPPTEWRYVIALDRREQDLGRLLTQLLDRQATETQLLMLQNHWYRAAERVQERFAAQPPQSTNAALLLAELAHHRGAEDDARDLVRRAHTFQQITGDESFKARVDQLAKTLDVAPLPTALTGAALEAVQLPNLSAPGEVVLVVGPRQPAFLWLGDIEKQQRLLKLNPTGKARQPGPCPLQVRSIKLFEGGRSWSDSTTGDLTSTGRTLVVEQLPGGEQIEVVSRPLEPAGQFELRVRRTAAP